MERTELGQLSVSTTAFGTMLFGTATEEGVAFDLLDRFVAAGGNFVDTSNNYAFWERGATGDESEALLGRWIAARRNRNSLVVATKVGAKPMRPGSGLKEIEGLSRTAIESSVEESLRRLGIETIDLYYAHIDDRTVALDETLEAFDRLIKAGKVREIGCSNYLAWRLAQADQVSGRHGFASYCCIQQRFSYLRPQWRADFGMRQIMGEVGGHGIEEDVTPDLQDFVATKPGFRIVAYSPLLRGAYSQPQRLGTNYESEDNRARLAVLHQIASELNVSAGQVVLAWLKRQGVVPLLSASTPLQLTENLSEVMLSSKQVQLLTEVRLE